MEGKGSEGRSVVGGVPIVELQEMAGTDPRAVDKNTLVDIGDVKIDTTLPERERMLDYIRQIKNPYCYLDHGTVVKISFSGNRRLEDCIINCIRPEQTMI